MAFFDCDEFLTFADGSSDIHAFLMKMKFWQYQVMHVTWKIYGDNDLLDGLSLRFGDDGTYSDQYSELLAVGAFCDATSQRVFEDRSKGMWITA